MKAFKHRFFALLFTLGIAVGANAATIHIPDAFLPAAVTGAIDLDTDTIKCGLMDVSSYARATDVFRSDITEATGTGYTAGGQTVTSITVTNDTTSHKTVITITPAVWSGATTISATGAYCYKSTGTASADRLIVISDFGGTVSSSGGTYTVNAITLEFTHF
ncbi:MAG TPA: hypothetical protein PKE01_05200 [Rhodocyclaceae bacterium]|uniref:hypothetical protein n=1 Tax=Zoogloea sp. TaxID=49181 RepID=UPI002B9A64E9|nr:hypothetical protein [Zoogloea sp.]HMV62707.1 hypothetical protein [Rhodocyclaceae bacterium]HMY98119.1 hypothetical protein [Burkholderiaceae bacterium]HNH16408.1 hypothetical protein [Zoogloea sp.]